MIFDAKNIKQWLETHTTNPVNSTPLKASDLITLNFSKNNDNEFADPVSSRVFTDSSHIVALKSTGNVFSWDSVERFNIKAKSWIDLVSGEPFKKSDIITIQDPKNIDSRNYKAIKPGKDVKQDEDGDASKVAKAKAAVAKARAERLKDQEQRASNSAVTGSLTLAKAGSAAPKKQPYNAAQYSTGRAAASFTSTGVTPYTSNERATLTDEEYMLKPKRIKIKGYATIHTNHGDLNLELYPEYAPKAVWNFVQLSKKSYYKGVNFHRNIKGFMLQGGDPTATGRGGASIWKKNFEDEFDGPLKHDSRGVLAMANKGKNTNSSQFFITYRGTTHLDNKHTIFGKLVEGMDTLNKLEQVPADDKDRPLEPITIVEVTIVVDPFEEFQKQRVKDEEAEKVKQSIKAAGGTEDDKTTWTGKRIRANGQIVDNSPAVGQYLKAAATKNAADDKNDTAWTGPDVDEPATKRTKRAGGFNFDGW